LVAASVAVLFLLVFGALVAVQIPAVQNYIADKVLSRVSETLGGHITVGDIEIRPMGVVVVKNLTVLDNDPLIAGADTLARVGRLTAAFSIGSLMSPDGMKFGRVAVDDALFHLTSVPGDESGKPLSNLQTVFHLVPKDIGPDDLPQGGPNLFRIRRVMISNLRFRMESRVNGDLKGPVRGMNYADLDLLVSSLDARAVKFSGGIFSGKVKELNISEKSGYSASLSGDCRVGMGEVIVDGMKLDDPWSSINFESVHLTFTNITAFSDFLHRVRLDVRFRPSVVAVKSIAYIGSGSLMNNPGVYRIKHGQVEGTVSDMNIKNLEFNESWSSVSGQLNARIYGLPVMPEFGIDGSARSLRFTTRGLSRFVNSWSVGSSLDLGGIAPGRTFILDTRISGLLDSLFVDGGLSSSAGFLNLDCNLCNVIDGTDNIRIGLGVSTASFDVGSFISSEALGETAFEAGARMELVRGGGMSIVLDSLDLNRFQAKGYEYRNIGLRARLEDRNLWLRMIARDENLRANVLANLDLSPSPVDSVSEYRLSADFERINPFNLNLVKSPENFGASFGVDMNLRADRGKMFGGKIELADVRLDSRNGSVLPGDFSFTASVSGGRQSLRMESRPASLSLVSDKWLGSIVPDFLNATMRRELSAIFTAPSSSAYSTSSPGYMEMKLLLSDCTDLTDFFVPGLFFESGTELLASMDHDGTCNVHLSSSRLALGENYIKDPVLSLGNASGKLAVELNGSSLCLGSVSMSSPFLQGDASDNLISADFGFKGGMDKDDAASLSFSALAFRNREDKPLVNVVTRPSYLQIARNRWLLDNSSFTFENGGITVENLYFHNGNQNLIAYGSVNTGNDETLTVDLNAFDFSTIDSFLQKDFGFGGSASGSFLLETGPGNPFGLTTSVEIDSLKVGRTFMGDFRMSSSIGKSPDNVDFRIDNSLGERNPLELSGCFHPSTRSLELEACLKNFNLGIASPFFSGLFNSMGGGLSGNFSLSGPTDSLEFVTSGARFDDASIKLAFTGAPYILDGDFFADNSGLHFDSLSIRDDSGGSAILSGVCNYRKFKDVRLDANVSFEQMKVIDSPETGPDSMYGHIKATGKATVKGPLNALAIDADISTDGSGDIHVPLSGKLSSTRSELLTYTDHSSLDAYAKMLEKYKIRETTSSSDIRIRASVGINEGLNASLEIDKNVGNVISFSGDGHVDIDLRPSKSLFNLSGDYNISSGQYHFVIPGLLSKDLHIGSGSSIKFGGDFADSQIDIKASYGLRTSLSTLITDTTKVSTRKNVECGITISNKLSNPDIGFFINVPDLDPTTKSMVEGCLNTEDKVQKQFVALLLLGTFIPNEKNGVFNGANVLYSNLGEVVSSQLNNILQKLDIPLDLGLSYEETTRGYNAFDVAVSTKLFDDRVSVSGSLGSRKYKTSSTGNSDFIGDVDVEVKIDNEGKYRAKLFSHSADSYTNFLDNSQRNGVGISFQKDFGTKIKDSGTVTINLEK